MNLLNSLGTLESAGLIQVAKIEPDLEYLFRHSMVQDAAYASLLESDRKRLHLAVADAIERLYPDRTKELAAILAYHLKEADQDDRALRYFIIAGDEALAVFANREAELQYMHALELKCCSGSDIGWLYSGLGEALYRQSRFDESMKAFRSGIEIYQSLGDDEGVARLYARLGRVEWYAGNRPEGLRVCLEGLERVKDAPESQGKAALLHETARAYYFNGNSDLALPLCRRALALAEQFNAVHVLADSLATFGILVGVPAEVSLESLRKAVELAEANGLLQVAMRAHINLGTMIRGWLADNDAALQHFRRAAELGKLRGVASEEMLGLTTYISCLFAPGKLTEIEVELPRLEALVEQMGNPVAMQVLVKYVKAVLINHRGDWDTAIEISWECLESYKEQKNHESTVNMLDELSWQILEKNRWGEPVDLSQVDKLLEDALSIVSSDNTNEGIWVYPRLVILCARQGRVDESRQWLDKVHQELSAKPTAWEDRIIGECEAEIAIALQDWDTAIIANERVAKFEKRLGFKVGAARALLCWADICIHRSNALDLENAQTLLREAIIEFTEMGIGHYPDIALEKLKAIQTMLRTQTIENEQMTKELRKARHVQESLLPEFLPDLPGWDLAVLLEPAHETSGDFYDYLSLPDGNLGLVIADVTDKGTSAALFMALSRSLWRTFAMEHPAEPERAMADTNRRIVSDTHGGLFITVLYGILNPKTGEFSYCSAGHHPAFLLRANDGSVEKLGSTGFPLGIMDETSWNRVNVQIEVGDALVMYTDGLTDAQNNTEEFFGLDRLQEVIQKRPGTTARELRDSLREEVRKWVGTAPQFDDITLMVVMRK